MLIPPHTAQYLSVNRIPAYKGQAIPAHDPRSVKGTGVTYFTSPMGADHTAGLTYKMPRNRDNQAENSLRSQFQAATCDAFGYCLNSVPGGRASIYQCLADLMNATYGLRLTPNDIMEICKQTLRDQLTFNEKAEFSKMDSKSAAFVRKEKITPTGQVFDVDDAEIDNLWKGLDSFQEKEKVWEVRIPPLPDMMFGAGVVEKKEKSFARTVDRSYIAKGAEEWGLPLHDLIALVLASQVPIADRLGLGGAPASDLPADPVPPAPPAP